MLILCYHRVARARSDPWGLCVTPDHFADQMAVLRADWNPMPLPELAAAAIRGDARPGGVAVTFDDGYVDNLLAAKPRLERWAIPATVFVATGYVASGRQFWWDVLQELLLNRQVLPPSLSLEIEGTTHHWELGASARFDSTDSAEHAYWRAWNPPPTPRHALYASVWTLLRPLAEAPRLDLLGTLMAWAASASAEPPLEDVTATPPRAVNGRELARLAEGDLIALGAHTVTHPLLPSLPASAQHEEVDGSRRALEQLARGPVTSLAYPYGAFDAATLAAVRAAGLTLACAGGSGMVTSASDPLQLPRVQVRDWDATEFQARLSVWSRG